MRKPSKKIHVQLTDTDRAILNSYASFASCLSMYLGEAYEIAVHSFGDGEPFTLRLVNGGITGRTVVDKVPENAYFAIEQLQIKVKHGDPHITINFSAGPEGRKYKSASIAILGEQRRMIGMICFNCSLDTPLYKIIQNFSLPSYLDAGQNPVGITDSSRYDAAITQTIVKVKDSVMNDPEIPAKFKRKEIVRQLNDSGVFKVKNAIQICAEMLDITIATIYMHIRNLDSE